MAAKLVLHLRDTYEIGGPGKTILETFRAIDASRYALHLAVFQGVSVRDESPFMAAAGAAGMPVHVVRSRSPYDPRLPFRVAALARRLGADVLHAHEAMSDVVTFVASRLRRTSTVTTLHGWIGNSAKQRVHAAADRLVLRGFDRVIAVSGEIQRAVIGAGVSPSRVVLLHNAIVAERYRRTGSAGFLREKSGREVARPVLTSLGRLSPEKGQQDLLEALAQVRREGGNFTAVFAGDGPDRASLERQAAQAGLLDRVLFVGHVSPPNPVLEETDLLVLPSHTEGLPNAVLEALLMDVPVLATAVGGTPEILEDGVTGRMVAPRQPAALAGAILDYLRRPDEWRRMAGRGKAVVETRFDFGTRTRRLEQVYDTLTESGR